MFTGIVQELGRVLAVNLATEGGRLSVLAPQTAPALNVDDSVAVNGVCLTVIARDESSFTVEVVPETLSRTDLGELKAGDRVCLEAAVTMSTPLGGHLVQGHIDGTATIVERTRDGLQESILFEASPQIMRYIVPKGFVALDGVSLTVVDCDQDRFSIALIPHSAAQTTLGLKQVGQPVNVEVDMVAKYVERFIGETSKGGSLREVLPQMAGLNIGGLLKGLAGSDNPKGSKEHEA